MAQLDWHVYHMQSSTANIQNAWNECNQDVEQYAAAVSAAQVTQQTYLDNLVSGVKNGGITLEQLEEMLNEQFAKSENKAQIVADAIAYVKENLDAAADSASGLGDGLDGSVANATQLNNAINPILDEMNKLGQAYQDAYDSAYDSIGGQIHLFDQVENLIKEDTQDEYNT